MPAAVKGGFVVLTAITLRLWFFSDPLQPPQLAKRLNSTYDYIVVGAGSAGCVVASRLSEDQNVTVLLLEAGDYDDHLAQIIVPGLSGGSFKSRFDWWYETEPKQGVMTGLKDGRSYWPRGRVLGGSSSINGMVYTRGSRHDYDRWAEYTKDQRWSYRHVLPYFKKSEDIRISELENSSSHGHNGPLTVSLLNTEPITDKIIEAGQAAGYPHNLDYNERTQQGFSHAQVTMRNSERMSTARGYIHPVLDRKNLHVAVRAHVTKINIENRTAVGVEVIKDSRRYTVSARREIILSAGVVGSPQILMLSGVGPKKHLEDLKTSIVLLCDDNFYDRLWPRQLKSVILVTAPFQTGIDHGQSEYKIPVVADLPVGQNLHEQVMFYLGVRIREALTTPASRIVTWWTKLQYMLFRSGPLSSNSGGEVMAFISTTNETREKDWPDVQLIFRIYMPSSAQLDFFNYGNKTKAELAGGLWGDYGFTCFPVLLRPESRGNITLRSVDPFDYPVIQANYLDQQADTETLIRAVQECKKVVKAKPMQDIGAEFTENMTESACKQHTYNSPEYWECLVKYRSLSVYHPVGTCKMGPREDPTTVVDSEMRVHGLSGLRVADASIMPWVTSGNTNVPTIMIGERAADLIKGDELPPLD